MEGQKAATSVVDMMLSDASLNTQLESARCVCHTGVDARACKVDELLTAESLCFRTGEKCYILGLASQHVVYTSGEAEDRTCHIAWPPYAECSNVRVTVDQGFSVVRATLCGSTLFLLASSADGKAKVYCGKVAAGSMQVSDMSCAFDVKPQGSMLFLNLPATGWRTVDAEGKTAEGGTHASEIATCVQPTIASVGLPEIGLYAIEEFRDSSIATGKDSTTTGGSLAMSCGGVGTIMLPERMGSKASIFASLKSLAGSVSLNQSVAGTDPAVHSAHTSSIAIAVPYLRHRQRCVAFGTTAGFVGVRDSAGRVWTMHQHSSGVTSVVANDRFVASSSEDMFLNVSWLAELSSGLVGSSWRPVESHRLKPLGAVPSFRVSLIPGSDDLVYLAEAFDRPVQNASIYSVTESGLALVKCLVSKGGSSFQVLRLSNEGKHRELLVVLVKREPKERGPNANAAPEDAKSTVPASVDTSNVAAPTNVEDPALVEALKVMTVIGERVSTDGQFVFRSGSGASADYDFFCTGCFTEYKAKGSGLDDIPQRSGEASDIGRVQEPLRCEVCGSTDRFVAQTERVATLKSKISTERQRRLEKQERIARFEKLHNSNCSIESRLDPFAKYKKWDAFESDDDEIGLVSTSTSDWNRASRLGEFDGAPNPANTAGKSAAPVLSENVRAFERSLEENHSERVRDSRVCDSLCDAGAARLKQGDLEGALESFNSALEVQSSHLRSLSNKALALTKLNRLEECIKVCGKIIKYITLLREVDRTNVEVLYKAYVRSTLAHTTLGDYVSARNLAMEAATLEKSFPQVKSLNPDKLAGDLYVPVLTCICWCRDLHEVATELKDVTDEPTKQVRNLPSLCELIGEVMLQEHPTKDALLSSCSELIALLSSPTFFRGTDCSPGPTSDAYLDELVRSFDTLSLRRIANILASKSGGTDHKGQTSLTHFLLTLGFILRNQIGRCLTHALTTGLSVNWFEPLCAESADIQEAVANEFLTKGTDTLESYLQVPNTSGCLIVAWSLGFQSDLYHSLVLKTLHDTLASNPSNPLRREWLLILSRVKRSAWSVPYVRFILQRLDNMWLNSLSATNSRSVAKHYLDAELKSAAFSTQWGFQALLSILQGVETFKISDLEQIATLDLSRTIEGCILCVSESNTGNNSLLAALAAITQVLIVGAKVKPVEGKQVNLQFNISAAHIRKLFQLCFALLDRSITRNAAIRLAALIASEYFACLNMESQKIDWTDSLLSLTRVGSCLDPVLNAECLGNLCLCLNALIKNSDPGRRNEKLVLEMLKLVRPLLDLLRNDACPGGQKNAAISLALLAKFDVKILESLRVRGGIEALAAIGSKRVPIVS